MSGQRVYRRFVHREAVFRIWCAEFEAVRGEIVRQRRILEEYIERHGEFREALEPVRLLDDAPEVARRMGRAADIVGVGPMAAVAGAMAQMAVEAAMRAGSDEAIVDNGGDIYVQTRRAVTIGLYTGIEGLDGRLGFVVEADDTPVAICSSSGMMGHSFSKGKCDLCTVAAKDASIADAAATLGANLVQEAGDVDGALEQVEAIAEVDGVMIVKGDRVGLVGRLPRLVRLQE
jgi:hypothetical protein